jgi:hypothetical protein
LGILKENARNSNLLLFIRSLRLHSFDQRAAVVVDGDAAATAAAVVVVDGVEPVEDRRLLFQAHHRFMAVRRLRFLQAQEVVECAQEMGGHRNPTGVRVALLRTIAD